MTQHEHLLRLRHMLEARHGPYADLWALDPAVDYLNHGSFGACPKAILEKQSELRMRLEREPVDFFIRALPGLLADARTGARVVVAEVPFPLHGEDDVIAPILAAATPRTCLAMLDHVTSPTALVFPIERLVRELSARGVDTLVDGAHALGMIPLDLARLGAAYYTANAHKWLCAPKGAAFLHVRKDRQKGLHPVAISHGYAGGETRFKDEFDWTGTADPTAAFCIPDCIRYLGGLLPGGWPAVMAANRALALKARAAICEALDVASPAPESMLGAMASVPLPAAAPGSPAARLGREDLADWTRARGAEPWFYDWPVGRGKLVRVSAQLYNTEEQFVRLAVLLAEALREG